MGVSAKKTIIPFPSTSSCVIFAVTLLYFGIFVPLGVDFHHDGVMLVPAVDIASGKVLFRDSFCQYGLLTPLLQALAVKLGGAELIAIKLSTLLFYGGCAVLLDKLWSGFLSSKWRYLNLALFWGLYPATMVTFHPWSSVYALFFMLLSALWMRCFLEKSHSGHLLASGAAAALALLARHPCGIVTIIAAILIFLITAYVSPHKLHPYWRAFKNSICFLLGCSVPILAAWIYIFCLGAWEDFYIQCLRFVSDFVWRRGGEGNWQSISDAFFPILTSLGFLDVIYALFPLVTFGLLGAQFYRRENILTKLSLIYLLIFSLGSWHQYYPVPCVRHLFWGAAPMFGAYALLCQQISQSRKLQKIGLIILFLPILMAFYPRMVGAFLRISSISTRPRVDIPGVHGLALTNREAKILSTLYQTVKSLPAEIQQRGVFNHTPDGLFSIVLPRCKFIHPMFAHWSDVPYLNYDREFSKIIQYNHPLILSTSSSYFPGYYPLLQFEHMGNTYRLLHPLE